MAGPFDSPPFQNFQVSPIGLVPKKNSTKFRTIFHLSYPKSGSTSVNHSISKDNFSLQYITIDDAIEGIKQFGSGCFLAKTDIESAFRLVPIHLDDYELLGMCWEGKYYYDKVLPFGLQSTPSIFNRLSDALEWILLHKCNISFVCHILDDFRLIESPAGTLSLNRVCQQSLTKMVSTFENLRIPIAPGKTQGPSQVLEFLGILVDTINMKASLPPEKIERMYAIFEQFQHRRSCTLKELQSLIGTLNFACKVVPPGRPFLQRIIALTRNIKKPHHHIKLNSGFFHNNKVETKKVKMGKDKKKEAERQRQVKGSLDVRRKKNNRAFLNEFLTEYEGEKSTPNNQKCQLKRPKAIVDEFGLPKRSKFGLFG